MKIIYRTFLMLSFFATSGYSQCTYFRLSAKLESCKTADPKNSLTQDPYQAVADIPELQETKAQALAQVTCDCDYSLEGSDPRCDIEESVEKSSLVGADDVPTTCRRGHALCRDVCPSRLP